MKKLSFDCLAIAHFEDVPLPENMENKSASEIATWVQEQLYRDTSTRYRPLVESPDNKYVSFTIENVDHAILDDYICIENEDGTVEEYS